MTERFLFDRSHGREVAPNAQEILLSDRMDRTLTEAGGAADKMADDFRAFGVAERHVARYRAAVDTFLAERPTELEQAEDRTTFLPRLDYFGLHLQVPQDFARVESICRAWKPRLGGDAGVRFAPVDDGALFEQALRDWPRTATEGSHGLDRFIARLNRLQYALHDPIHVAQNISSGDRLNRYRERFDADGTLFDTERSEAFVREQYTSLEPLGAQWNHDATVPFAPVDASDTPEAERDRQFMGLYRNEATMDALVEFRMRPVLREEPALCAWMHNRVVHLSAILREFNARAADGRISVFERQSSAILRIVESLAFVTASYFAAFDSTADAEAYFREDHSVLGKPLSASILHGRAMTRLDVLAVEMETRAIVDAQDIDIHVFPSGERVRYATKRTHMLENPPISNRGAELAAGLFEAAAARGASGGDLQLALYGLQYALEDDAPSEEVLEHAAKIGSIAGTNMNETDARELFGACKYVSVRGFAPEQYARALAVRKAVMDRLRRSRPEALNELVQSVLYDSSETVGRHDLYALTGFGMSTRSGVSGEIHVYKRSLGDIFADTKLGILGLDMTRLDAAGEAKVRKAYEELGAYPQASLAVLERTMAVLTELKRKQLAV